MSERVRRVLAGQVDVIERLATELAARMDVAQRAILKFDRLHEGQVNLEIGARVFAAALHDYPDVVEAVLRERGVIQALDARTIAAATDLGLAAPPTVQEEHCGCCNPPVPLSKHHHAPIKDVALEEAPLQRGAGLVELVDTPRGRNRAARYAVRGEERLVPLGRDRRVEVVVTGDTWSAPEQLREARLRWNGKQGAESKWGGRVGVEGLELLAALEEKGGIHVQIIEDEPDPEQAPPRQRERPGRDFY